MTAESINNNITPINSNIHQKINQSFEKTSSFLEDQKKENPKVSENKEISLHLEPPIQEESEYYQVNYFMFKTIFIILQENSPR